MGKPNKKHLLIYTLFGAITDKYHKTLDQTLKSLSQYENIFPVVICDEEARRFLSAKNRNCLILEMANTRNYSRFTEISRIKNIHEYHTMSFRDADSSFTAQDYEIIEEFSRKSQNSILTIRDSRYHVWPLMAGLTTISAGLYDDFCFFIDRYEFNENWFSDQICLAEYYQDLNKDDIIYHWGRGIRFRREVPLIEHKIKRKIIINNYSGYWGMPLHNPASQPKYDLSHYSIPMWISRKNRFLILIKVNLLLNRIIRRIRYVKN